MKNALGSVVWGTFEGAEIRLWRLVNAKGTEVQITNYGGRIVRVLTRDRSGALDNVTLGWNSLEEYVKDGGTYYGALVGRYGNRIGEGKFALDGQTYTLECTNAPAGIPCALHGGTKGFALRAWTCAEEIREADKVGVVLAITSPDGEGGYPGNVKVEARVTLSDDDVFEIAWSGETDKATPLAVTCHSYWNLDGVDAGTKTYTQELQLEADAFTPYTPGMIPTGEIRPVEGTPFDFRSMRPMGDHTADPYPEVKYGAGYDMNWVIRGADGTLRKAATLRSPKTGREIQVWTTEPGVQVYDGYYLPVRNAGVAIETQHYPDSPNHPEFPTVILRPGEKLSTVTQYRFGNF